MVDLVELHTPTGLVWSSASDRLWREDVMGDCSANSNISGGVTEVLRWTRLDGAVSLSKSSPFDWLIPYIQKRVWLLFADQLATGGDIRYGIVVVQPAWKLGQETWE